MAGVYQYEIELKSNVAKLLTDMKEVQDRLDSVEGREYKVNLGIDSKKLENVISNLDKMLTRLGRDTSDFKEFENLSKQLNTIVSEVQALNKEFGKINDSGISSLVSSIRNIDNSLTSLREHIVGVNKDFGNIGKNAGNLNNTVAELLKVDEVISKVSEHAKSLTGRDNDIFNNRLNGIKDILGNQDILKLFNQYYSQTMNFDSLREMVIILTECRESMLSTEEISKRFSSVISSQFTAIIPEAEKLDTSIFEISKTIKEFSQAKGILGQTSGKDLFAWISENATESQKEIFKVFEGYEKFQSVLRGLSTRTNSAMNYSDTLGLDTFNFDISAINSFLNKESELVSGSNIAENELKELRTALMSTFNISPNGDGSLTVTLKQLQEIVDQCPKAKQYIDEINSSMAHKSNISSGIKDVFQGEQLKEASSSARVLEDNIENISNAISKASQALDEYKNKWKILSQVGEATDDSFSATYEKNKGQIEVLKWKARKDEDGNYVYDENGDKQYDTTSTIISNYQKLEKEIISADNALRKLEADKAKITQLNPNASTSFIQSQINDQKEYISLLEQTITYIANVKKEVEKEDGTKSREDAYLIDPEAIQEARLRAKREYELDVGSKGEMTSAKQSASDEKRRLANIEQVNRALNRQQIIIDSIEKTYDKTKNKDLDRAVSNNNDLAELARKKSEIQELINKLNGQERTSTNESEFLKLDKLISEYKELAKYKLKANNPSKQELGGQNLQTLIEQQIPLYDKLIVKAEKYGDKTSETVEKLKEQRRILSATDKNGKFTATADDYYKSRDNYKVEAASLSAYEARYKAIESINKKLSSAISKYSYGDSTDATAMMKQLERGLGNFGDLSDIEGNISRLQSTINNIIADLKSSHEQSLSALNQEIKSEQELQSQKDAFHKRNISAIDLEIQKREEEAKMFSSTLKAQMEDRQSKLSSIQSLINTSDGNYEKWSTKPTDQNRSVEYQQALDKYKGLITSLREELTRLSNIPIINDEELKKSQELSDSIKNSEKAIKSFSAAEKGSTLSARSKEIDKISKYLKENTKLSEEAKQKLREYIRILQEGGGAVNVEEINNAFLKVVATEREAGREGKSFLDIFKNKALYGFASQLAMYYLSFYDFVRYARNAVNAIRELDTALIDLKKTTTMSDSQLESFYYSSNDVAKEMGVTTAEIINQASAWSRFNKIDPLYSNVY